MPVSARQIIKECVTALSVLALVFLTFAQHQPGTDYANVSLDTPQFSIISFCGDGLLEDHGAHGPCHACRSSIATLPPPPCEAEPAYTRIIASTYRIENDKAHTSRLAEPYNPRAPPVSV